MFERIGAFHLGTGHDKPVEALERELKHIDGRNGLIVLPEAFNLGAHYSVEPGIPMFERDVVIKQLSAIARCWAITFVVGLLEPKPEDSGRPHSSAYFISATEVYLMCHKQRWDGSGHYSVCPEAPDRANPIIRDDASVIAAICMDAQNDQRFGEIATRARQAQKKHNFVCIPAARSNPLWFSGCDQRFLKDELNENGKLILANSDCRGRETFITGPDWRVLASVEHGRRAENHLLIAPA